MSPLIYCESYTYDTVLPVEADVHTVEQVPGFANVSVSGVPVVGVMVSVKSPAPNVPFGILK